MEILLGISILFNVVFAAVALNLYNRGKEQIDEIEGLNGAVIRERRSSKSVLTNTLELRKYRHHRSWFRGHYPNQDFDDLIDMLLFMHINQYTDGDSIDYPSDIAYEDMNEDMDLTENNQETEDTNSILDSIGTDQEMYEAEDNHSRLRADAEDFNATPEATYVESSYERSSPSSSYDSGSSSSDSGGSSD